MFWFGIAIIIITLMTLKHLGSSVNINEFLVIFISIPRLHDLDKSGWYAIIPFTAEIFFIILMSLYGNNEYFISLIGFIYIVFIVILGAIPGQSMANRFGNPPRPWLGGVR